MNRKKSKRCPLRSMNRRRFLKDLGKGTVAAITAPTLYSLVGCEDSKSPQGAEDAESSRGADDAGVPQDAQDAESPRDGVVRLTKPDTPPSGTAVVSIVRKDSIESSVQRAIEIAGGLSEISSGDTVVIKPNIVGVGFGVRPYTHPLVLQAVIKEVKARTSAENITVAEASYQGPGSNGTTANAQETGILDVIESEGVNFVAWDQEGVEFVQIESDDLQNIGYPIELPKTLTDGTYDHFINLPMIKDHFWQNAGYTCCIKNFVGTLRLSIRGMKPSMDGHDWIDLARGVAELNLSTPNIAMNVVDGLSVVLKYGPMFPSMITHDADLIVASKDRIAADTMALAIMRFYASLDSSLDEPYQHLSVWEQPQITRALELNLGRTSDNIEYVDDGVSEIDGIIGQWS